MEKNLIVLRITKQTSLFFRIKRTTQFVLRNMKIVQNFDWSKKNLRTFHKKALLF